MALAQGYAMEHHQLALVVHALVVSCVAFVLSLFVPHLSFFWCLGKAVLCVSYFLGIFTYIFINEFYMLIASDKFTLCMLGKNFSR